MSSLNDCRVHIACGIAGYILEIQTSGGISIDLNIKIPMKHSLSITESELVFLLQNLLMLILHCQGLRFES
jgi:hypothetical protein